MTRVVKGSTIPNRAQAENEDKLGWAKLWAEKS